MTTGDGNRLIESLRDAGRRAAESSQPCPTVAGTDGVTEARQSIVRAAYNEARYGSTAVEERQGK